MTSTSRRWLTRLAITVALWPARAEAQTTASSFKELAGIVRTDETIIVTDTTARTIKGVLTAIDDDSLSLATGGRTRIFVRSDVRSVRLADGVGNGALIGGSAGLGSALGILAVLGSEGGYVLPSAKVGAPLLLSGLGALVGALIDRAHEGGRVLYLSPAHPVGGAVSSVLMGDQRVVYLSVRF
jgi:hypothetical protein